MDRQTDAHPTSSDFPSWSELSRLIEDTVTKAVTASVSNAMAKMQLEISNLGDRISTLDNNFSTLSTELTTKTSTQSSRITAVENHIAQIANQCASDSILLDVKTGSLTEVELAVQKLKEDNQKLRQTVNDLDQQSRDLNLRFTGLGVQSHTSSQEIYSFIRDRLNIMDFRESDIAKVVVINKKRLPPSMIPHSSPSASLDSAFEHATKPLLIVTFSKKKIRDEVLMKRRLLKGSHIGISEDLTPLNSRFIAMYRKDPRIKNIWSWNGRLYLTLLIDDKKRSVIPTLTLDAQLDNS